MANRVWRVEGNTFAKRCSPVMNGCLKDDLRHAGGVNELGVAGGVPPDKMNYRTKKRKSQYPFEKIFQKIFKFQKMQNGVQKNATKNEKIFRIQKTLEKI